MSLIYRHARDNGYPMTHLIRHLHLQDYALSRVIDAPAMDRVTSFFGIDEQTVQSMTLAGLPPEIVGTIDPRVADADPLGWANRVWSHRCRACHDEGSPWALIHQTGLTWICHRHNTFLAATCSRCAPSPWLFSRPTLSCHLDLQESHRDGPTADDVAAQRVVVGMLAQTKAGARLQNLRAATVIAALEDAGRREQQQVDPYGLIPLGGRSAVRLQTQGRLRAGELRPQDLQWNVRRPHPVPAVMGTLIRRALQFIDDEGTLDREWTDEVWSRAHLSRAARRTLRPYAVHVGINPPPRPTASNIQVLNWNGDTFTPATAWVEAVELFRKECEQAHWSPDNIPASLHSGHVRFDQKVVPSLARAVLVRNVLFGDSTTGAIRAFGAGSSRITQVRHLLRRPPTPSEVTALTEALAQLLTESPTNYAELRRRQGAVTHVNEVILRGLHLQPPSTETVCPSHAATIWLWSTVTRTHPTLAPFADGRSIQPVLKRLDNWHRTAAPEALTALLDWNQEHNLEDVTTADPATTSNADDANIRLSRPAAG